MPTMKTSWFNPFTGETSTPEEQNIPQWPAVEAPHEDGFRVLIVEIPPKAKGRP